MVLSKEHALLTSPLLRFLFFRSGNLYPHFHTLEAESQSYCFAYLATRAITFSFPIKLIASANSGPCV